LGTNEPVAGWANRNEKRYQTTIDDVYRLSHPSLVAVEEGFSTLYIQTNETFSAGIVSRKYHLFKIRSFRTKNKTTAKLQSYPSKKHFFLELAE
jgi:hypothetical protein